MGGGGGGGNAKAVRHRDSQVKTKIKTGGKKRGRGKACRWMGHRQLGIGEDVGRETKNFLRFLQILLASTLLLIHQGHHPVMLTLLGEGRDKEQKY